jgi:hypothetical protein
MEDAVLPGCDNLVNDLFQVVEEYPVALRDGDRSGLAEDVNAVRIASGSAVGLPSVSSQSKSAKASGTVSSVVKSSE